MTWKIELVGISKSYPTDAGPLHVLNDVSLQVAEQQFVSILGPSGCGKSTIFNIICGLEEPDSGAIFFSGKRLTDPSKALSYMPQKDLLLPWRKIIDNVILPLQIAGVDQQSARQRAMELLDIFGLKGFEQHYPSELSGGMRQRAALMRTILTDRDVLLLDEPFGALDAITRFHMQTWLLDVWQRFQRTILFITHDVEEAIYLSDKVYVMSQRPSGIRLALDIPLSRPRHPEQVTSPEFVELKRTVLKALT